MDRDQNFRFLTICSLVVAFVLGVVFAVIGLGLRPRVALAPALPPTPQSVVASDGGDWPDSMPGDGTHDVPDGYPVKGNHRSGIYHQPGGLAYDRTIATVYFRSADAAKAAGYRASKA